jgi:hypothetical protein
MSYIPRDHSPDLSGVNEGFLVIAICAGRHITGSSPERVVEACTCRTFNSTAGSIMSKTHVDEDEKQTPGSVQVIDPTDETAYEPIEIDPEVEKRVVRKIDRTILIIFSFIYMWQYLDKIALSYAVIFGMREDLNFQGQDYSWVSSIFCECHSCS